MTRIGDGRQRMVGLYPGPTPTPELPSWRRAREVEEFQVFSLLRNPKSLKVTVCFVELTNWIVFAFSLIVGGSPQQISGVTGSQ